jgi:FlaA1/EpsC-like NDP-sugar epimerase
MKKSPVFNFFLEQIRKIKHVSFGFLILDFFFVGHSFLITYLWFFSFASNLLFLYSLFVFVAISTGYFLFIGKLKGVFFRGVVKSLIIGIAFLFLVSFFSFAKDLLFAAFLETAISRVSVISVFLLLCFIFLVGYQLLLERMQSQFIINFKPMHTILVYGVGSLALKTYQTYCKTPKNGAVVVGFIEADSSKIVQSFQQLPVYGHSQITKDFLSKNNITEVVIADEKGNLKSAVICVEKFLSASIKVKIVPPFKDWSGGVLKISQISDLKIEDLLRWDTGVLEQTALKNEFDYKTILITGAAGSIGSEIARQMTSFRYKKLILVDQSESPLYHLQQELRQFGNKDAYFIVADICSIGRMTTIFDCYKPDIVFHAAAYKHVPFMEENVYEAVQVNVLGAQIVMDLAIEYGVSKCLLISTDKAVNPTSVMGATKKIIEMYALYLNDRKKTKFITTRFGNVLESNGSVVPIFKKQIAVGGPLTVTHKEITRYFMTIQEACHLVLEAEAMGVGGEIFIFNMGAAISIFNLAVKMIQLAGLKYPEDIAIEFVGLRPGEKMVEEFIGAGEKSVATDNEKIRAVKGTDTILSSLLENMRELSLLSASSDSFKMVKKMKEIVPAYISNNSEFEKLDNLS